MPFRIFPILLIGLLLCGCSRDYYKIGERKVRIYTDLTRLPKPDKVRAIELEGQGLQNLPSELFRYKNLEYLNLRDNNIKSLPDSIQIFENLYALFLDDNPIKELPESIVSLSNLRAMTLLGTDISSFPLDFKTLTKLEAIFIGGMDKLSYEEIQRVEKEMPWCNFVRSID